MKDRPILVGPAGSGSGSGGSGDNNGGKNGKGKSGQRSKISQTSQNFLKSYLTNAI